LALGRKEGVIRAVLSLSLSIFVTVMRCDPIPSSTGFLVENSTFAPSFLPSEKSLPRFGHCRYIRRHLRTPLPIHVTNAYPRESSIPAAVETAAEPEKKKREYKDLEEKHEGDLHARVDVKTITLTAGDLYDKDKVDIEHVVMEEVFQLLQCDDKGLTEAEALNRIGIFGPNRLEEKKEK
jgi:hypothetical protein